MKTRKNIIDDLFFVYEEILESYGKPKQKEILAEMKTQYDKDNTMTDEVFDIVCETVALTCQSWEEGMSELERLDKQIYLKIPLIDLSQEVY